MPIMKSILSRFIPLSEGLIYTDFFLSLSDALYLFLQDYWTKKRPSFHIDFTPEKKCEIEQVKYSKNSKTYQTNEIVWINFGIINKLLHVVHFLQYLLHVNGGRCYARKNILSCIFPL